MLLAILTGVITDDGEHFVHVFIKHLDSFFGEMSLIKPPVYFPLDLFSLLICMKKI